MLGDLPLRVLVPLLFAEVNLFLGVFNFLPIPPLDGAALIERVLPQRLVAGLVPVPAVRHPRAVPARVQHRRPEPPVPAVPRSPLPVRPAMTAVLGHLARAVRRFAAAAAARRGRPRVRPPSAAAGGARVLGAPRARRPGRVGRDRPGRHRGARTRRRSRAGSRPRCCTTSARRETGLGAVGRSVRDRRGAVVVGHGRARAWPNAVGRYVNHDELGRAAAAATAGARPEAVAWAARPSPAGSAGRRPGIPPEICEILAAADGEPQPR